MNDLLVLNLDINDRNSRNGSLNLDALIFNVNLKGGIHLV